MLVVLLVNVMADIMSCLILNMELFKVLLQHTHTPKEGKIRNHEEMQADPLPNVSICCKTTLELKDVQCSRLIALHLPWQQQEQKISRHMHSKKVLQLHCNVQHEPTIRPTNHSLRIFFQFYCLLVLLNLVFAYFKYKARRGTATTTTAPMEN